MQRLFQPSKTDIQPAKDSFQGRKTTQTAKKTKNNPAAKESSSFELQKQENQEKIRIQLLNGAQN